MTIDYGLTYAQAKLQKDKTKILDFIYRCAMDHKNEYEQVANRTGIPWSVISAIHYRESDQNFRRHLHNGDPLSNRTIHVPKGRPSIGYPPFNWTDSAVDAMSAVWRPILWTLPGALEFMERYNGMGYQKIGILTPYLWDFTDQYTSGLFVSDHRFDPNVRENRAGCAAIFKYFDSKDLWLGLKDYQENPLLTDSDPVLN